MVKGWASRHLEVVLPVATAAGATVGVYFVGVFNAAKTAALARSYGIPSEFLSSGSPVDVVWVVYAGLLGLCYAYVGILAFDLLSFPWIRPLLAIVLSLITLATPPYAPWNVWVLKVAVLAITFFLVGLTVRVYRIARRLFRMKLPFMQNWRRPRWIPGRLWEPLIRELPTFPRAAQIIELILWLGGLGILIITLTLLIAFAGRWMGENLTRLSGPEWVLEGTQGSQRPVLVFRTTNYWIERPVQARGRSHGQRRFTPVGPVVIHSYGEGPLRLVWEEDFGIVTS
jgi:hypothetical protein